MFGFYWFVSMCHTTICKLAKFEKSAGGKNPADGRTAELSAADMCRPKETTMRKLTPGSLISLTVFIAPLISV